MTDHFQEKAQEYDAMDLPQLLSAGIGRAIAESVELRPGLAVMDFGAGTGLVTRHVADPVGHVTAVDVSPAMLEKLQAKPELEGKVEIVCQDILERPLDAQFDLIVSAMAMHHVQDTKALLRSFWEHLRPGGRVALADLDEEDGTFHPEDAPSVHHSGFAREALAGMLEAQGFDNVRFVTAVTVERDGRSYPVFLALASKPES
jgi:2-polyprenyl-3-methyl-5-hydroxy-6-metoxy-1,4-benzoquinol methylase